YHAYIDPNSCPTRRSSDLKHKEKWHQSHSQFHQDKDVVLNFNNKDTLFNQQSKTYYHEKFAKKEINDFLNNYTITNITKHTDSRSEEHTSELQSRFDLVCS